MSNKVKKAVLNDSTNTHNNFSHPPIPFSRSKSFKDPQVSHEFNCHFSFSSMTPLSNASLSASSLSFADASSMVLSQSSDHYETSSNSTYDQNDSLILNSTIKNKKKTVTDDTKYKTEMCKNWIELGKCNYGKKCKFAHGKHELVEKHVPNRNRYKSKKCNSFFTTMFCPYGVRCMFAHEQRTVEEINAETYYQRLLRFPELMDNPYTRNRARLPVFENLEQSGMTFESCFYTEIGSVFAGQHELSIGHRMFSL